MTSMWYWVKNGNPHSFNKFVVQGRYNYYARQWDWFKIGNMLTDDFGNLFKVPEYD